MSHAVLDRITERSTFDANAVALRDGGGMLRYGELLVAVAALADWLRTSGRKTVALRAENSIDWIVADLACQVAEVVCVPLPDFFSTAQTEHCLRSAGAGLLLTGPGPEAMGAAILPGTSGLHAMQLSPDGQVRLPAGTQKITFTSGSTGEPKGVCLDSGLQWRVARSLADAVDRAAGRHLAVLPLSTLLENVAGVYASLLRGGEVVLPDGPSRGLSGSSGLNLPKLLHCIDTERPHSLILVPQLLGALVAACQGGWKPPPSLRFVAVGGARVAAELTIAARRHGMPVFEGYGLSECGSVISLNTHLQDRLSSQGQVFPHCEVSIENDEIIVRGACHLGYVGDPGSWYAERVSTGDIGTLDSAGFLHVNGRRKNVLISSYGRNISPEWIESELCAQPLLTQCVVLGDGRPSLVAVLGAPAVIDDTAIQLWIDRVNRRLPDYARVGAWLRLDADTWAALSTANGRPRRAAIENRLAAEIGELYAFPSANAASY